MHCRGQRPAIDFLDDETKQRVIRIVVFVGGVGWRVGRVLERNGQQLVWSPNPRRVTVEARREFGGICIVVEATAHLQQLGDSDLVAVGYARNILRHRVAETQFVFLSQLHDDRGRHRLGIRCDPEVGVRIGRSVHPQLRRAVVDCEFSLGSAQEYHGAGDEEILCSCGHRRLQGSLIDRLERRRNHSVDRWRGWASSECFRRR